MSGVMAMERRLPCSGDDARWPRAYSQRPQRAKQRNEKAPRIAPERLPYTLDARLSRAYQRASRRGGRSGRLSGELDALLEPLDADTRCRRPRAGSRPPRALVVQAVARSCVGLVAQPVGGAAADRVASVEPVDLALDIVDPRLELRGPRPQV